MSDLANIGCGAVAGIAAWVVLRWVLGDVGKDWAFLGVNLALAAVDAFAGVWLGTAFYAVVASYWTRQLVVDHRKAKLARAAT